jgi:predicted nuclease of predicted toxin-antitoxin system
VVGNRTSDQAFFSFADAHDAVVVSKDRDFLDSHLLNGSPSRLLMVATGNITNRQLLSIFKNHIVSIENTFTQASWVELNAEGLLIHG